MEWRKKSQILYFLYAYLPSYRRRVGKGMGSILSPNRDKSCICAAMSVTRHSMSRGMPWPKTATIPYHPQLGLSDKGCAIKGLVVCYGKDES